MNVLVDSNVLVRMAQPGHAQYRAALDSTVALGLRGDNPCLVPQVLYELWVVATRPPQVNGIGLTPVQATAELVRAKKLFQLLPESPALYPEWERLVTTFRVTGKNAHDARLVAAMTCQGIAHILTFNAQDFSRYPGVTVLDPVTVASPPPATP